MEPPPRAPTGRRSTPPRDARLEPGTLHVREQRLLTCLFVSLTLHTAFLAFVPPLLTQPSSSLKRPLWVDLVDLKETAPPPKAPEAPPRQQQSPRPEDKGPHAKPRRPSVEGTEVRAAPVPEPRPLPSSRDLVPTMNSLLRLQRDHENPLYVEPSTDPARGIRRGKTYDAYIREVKEAVRENWRVSGDGEFKRGTTVIRVSISADGSLSSLDLLQSSGMILHDYEALDAIKQSFPLRSPPESLLDENGKLSIRFSFHYFPTSPG